MRPPGPPTTQVAYLVWAKPPTILPVCGEGQPKIPDPSGHGFWARWAPLLGCQLLSVHHNRIQCNPPCQAVPAGAKDEANANSVDKALEQGCGAKPRKEGRASQLQALSTAQAPVSRRGEPFQIIRGVAQVL